MGNIDRRSFLAAGITAASSLNRLHAAPGRSAVDEVLRTGIAQRKIPAVVGMVASGSRTLYTGAFGRRDSSGVPVQVDSIFGIMSMTKAVTTVAALQLVEQGKVALDEPVARHLPQFEKIQVLEGFSSDGQAVPAGRNHRAHLAPLVDPYLRTLLRHLGRSDVPLQSKNPESPEVPGPLMFEPGKRWQYGRGLDWTGRLVEAISGMTLEEYFQQKILRTFGMKDTSYILPAAKFDRLVSNCQRGQNGDLEQDDREPPRSSEVVQRRRRPLLHCLRLRSVHADDSQSRCRAQSKQDFDGQDRRQHEGEPDWRIDGGKMKSFRPNVSSDVDIQPGHTEKWGLGFLINTTPYAGGRSAGSLAWAGLYNTFYWIDPKRDLCAVILMQFLPFVDGKLLDS